MKISQQEARRLRKRVADLEFKFADLRNGDPGTTIGTVRLERNWLMGRIEMSKLLGCAIVVTEECNILTFRAVKPL